MATSSSVRIVASLMVLPPPPARQNEVSLNARSSDSSAESLTQVASAIPPASCTEAVQGAVDAGAGGLSYLNLN